MSALVTSSQSFLIRLTSSQLVSPLLSSSHLFSTLLTSSYLFSLFLQAMTILNRYHHVGKKTSAAKTTDALDALCHWEGLSFRRSDAADGADACAEDLVERCCKALPHCLRSLKIKVQEIARTSHLDTSVRVTSVTVRTRFHCTKWLNTAKQNTATYSDKVQRQSSKTRQTTNDLDTSVRVCVLECSRLFPTVLATVVQASLLLSVEGVTIKHNVSRKS